MKSRKTLQLKEAVVLTLVILFAIIGVLSTVNYLIIWGITIVEAAKKVEAEREKVKALYFRNLV